MVRIRKPSPAMGVALISLFIALTGTSIAAVAAFPPNSVGARELKNGSVGTKELKGRSVTFGKIAAGAITSGLVRNGSLTMSDFNQHQLPSGPIGGSMPRQSCVDRRNTESSSLVRTTRLAPVTATPLPYSM